MRTPQLLTTYTDALGVERSSPEWAVDHVREVLASHKFRKPPALAALTVDTPRWLDGLVTRMLAKDPDERPQAMAEVAEVLLIAEGAGVQGS